MTNGGKHMREENKQPVSTEEVTPSSTEDAEVEMTNGGKHLREEDKEPVSTEEVTPSSTEDAEMKEERKSHLVPVIIPSSTPTSSSSVPRSIIAFQRQVSLDGTTTTTAKSVIMQKAAGGATKLTASSSGGEKYVPQLAQMEAATTVTPTTTTTTTRVPVMSETTGSKFIFSQPNHTGMTQIIALSNAQAQKILKHDARGAQNQPILVAFTQPQSAAASIDTVTSQAQMTARRESPSPIKIIQSRPVTPETQAPSSGNVSQGSQVETSQQMPALVTTSSGTLSQSALKSQQSTFNIILQQQQQQFKLKFQQQQAKPTPKQASPQPSPSTTPQPPEPRPSAESNGSNSSSVGKRVEPNGAGSVGKRAESSTPPQASPSPQFIKFGQSQVSVIHIKKEFPSTTSSTCTTSAVINNVATGMPPLTSSSGGAPLMEVKKEEEDSLPALPEVSPSVNHLSSTTAETAMDPQDLKKLKRRQYQQKRRQSQTGASKEAAGAITAGTGGPTPKKRPRKSSRLEEDYDTFVDSLMTQLRTLCNMTVIEPSLGLNLAVCNPFGCGDLTKPDINFKTGELKGVHGKAWLPTESDYYSTEPFGDLAPIPCSTSPSTQRGFYDEEFAPLKFDSEYDERKLDLSRDVETPDSVISSSSPECVLPEHPAKYPGLRLIHSDDEMEDDTPPHQNLMDVKRHSPVIPLVVPIAVRPRPGSLYLKLNNDQDKENIGCSTDPRYPKYKGLDHHRPGTPLRDTANVFITLTVCSDMAQDVTSTLAKLSELLNIRPPAQFKVSEHRPHFENQWFTQTPELTANVFITLTVCSDMAQDVTSTLAKLSELLNIRPPAQFKVSEHRPHVVPPSAKLGLYRNKSKDGKEGVPVNIQSILNGEAKFCRHCDVIVLHNVLPVNIQSILNGEAKFCRHCDVIVLHNPIRKSAADLPLLAKEDGSEWFYFCSSHCYTQLALHHLPPSATGQDKVNSVVDHLGE
ncbi:uncharacterized protein LOC103512006 [Diaphorina citri]|uniref:Uncharacterized protein LOC103512006 n=1 Tax=Diaphorina citri TaxID=121845 RepID=A0A3Q0J373_DIACI|nr:uncharacterized protein LOC103512006 [Diaphorina citri]